MIEHIKYVMEKAKEEQPFPWQFMGYREDLVDANENFIIEGEVWGEWASEIIENAPEWLGYLIGEVERLKELDEENERLMQKLVEAHTLRGKTMIQNKELQKALETVRATLEHKKNDDRTSWGLWDVANKALERTETP